jgi:hypothetical protein
MEQIQDDRTMEAAAAKRYMQELHARGVAYSFQPLSHGLVTVTTCGVGKAMWNAYDALVATWKDFPPAVAKSFTAEESAGIELDRR